MTTPAHPITCVAVFVLNDKNELLVGHRVMNTSVKGVPEWALPAGKIDNGETAVQAAIREAKEETGLDITIDKQFAYSDDISVKPDDPRCYVTLYFQGHILSGTPQVMEPTKLDEWKWIPLDPLPSLFCGCQKHIAALDLRT